MIKQMIAKFIGTLLTEEMTAQREALARESASILHDITYRMNQLKETAAGAADRIHTSDLNIATHMLDGYTFTNNMNGATAATGFVSWADLNIVYKGVTYTIVNGSTNQKYVFWKLSQTDKTVLQVSNTKPTIGVDDILIGINNGGVFELTMSPGKMTPGAALTDGSIGSAELGSAAVTSAKLASGAVTSGAIASGAVGSTALADAAVTGTKIGSGAVGSTNIASGAVGSTALASGAVTSGKIGTGAVGSTNIASGAVGSTALASGAVTSAAIASGAVGSTALASGAVGSAALADAAVTGTKIGAGAIAEDKLNVATHFLF